MKRDLEKVLRYFAHFHYSPTLQEIHTFYPKKISRESLKKQLDLLKYSEFIVGKKGFYTLGEYSTYLEKTVQRLNWSRLKKEHIARYLKKISTLNSIQFIGYSGSVSMNNAGLDDDIDLFVITKTRRMWITRFLLLCLAEVMHIRRRRGKKKARNKVCLNMFIDERDLEMPTKKKTEYIAHEILQIKPILDRNETSKFFLSANDWVFEYFPNAQKYNIQKYKSTSNSIKNRGISLEFIGNIFEQIFKSIQLACISKHKTTERITDTQLWFFPDDYEKKL